MAEPAISYDPVPDEPLALLELRTGGAAISGARARQLELTCRGDRVRLDLLEPASGDGPFATLLFQPPPPEDVDLTGLAGLSAWLDAGVAVASVTFPLFGSRRSPKMTEKLETAVRDANAGREIDDNSIILWSEFTRQSVLELRRAIDALEETWGAPPSPVLFAGSGLAASLGAVLCAKDARLQAAVLASIGSHGPDGITPRSYVDEIAPRSVHEVAAADDAVSLLDAAWPLLSPHVVGNSASNSASSPA